MVYLPKSQPAPECLEAEKIKANGNHNCGEVLERLRTDFKDKCYICEEKNITSINTEHFIPHRGDKDLQFLWDNLFFSCYHCNNIKGHRTEYDSILNCTIILDGVDTKIKYIFESIPKTKVEITALEDEPRVHNTVNLLKSVYNGTTPLKHIAAENLKKKIYDEIEDFRGLLTDYFSARLPATERIKIKSGIVDHLDHSSPFTAFKRWIIRENTTYFNEFHQYL